MKTRWAYRIALALYPREYKAVFGDEMMHVFEEAAKERQSYGALGSAFVCISEIWALTLGAGREWVARWNYGAVYCQPQSQTAEVMAIAGVPREVCESQRRLDSLVSRMVFAIANHQFEYARRCADEETKERERLQLLKAQYGLES